jgi:hypothetical protein
VSDAWSGYTGLAARDDAHLSLSQAAMKRASLEGDAVIARIPFSGRSRASHYIWCRIEATG